ncbi:MAG: PhnD/SsuA/transferrin family substrate-binding protein [Myxococcota bacterium]
MALPYQIVFGISESYGRGGPELIGAAIRLVAVLEHAVGHSVRIQVCGEYTELLEGVHAGRVQVAWMSPLLHARAEALGATLVAVCKRGDALTYRSALLARDDSAIAGLADVRGKRIAWVDPKSASGYVFPRIELIGAGLDPKRDFASEHFYASSALAARAVIEGDADVCACYVGEDAAWSDGAAVADVRRLLGADADRLRVIHVTDAVPPDGMVVAASVESAERDRLRDALVSLGASEHGRAALHALTGADALLPVTDALRRTLAHWSRAITSDSG